MRGNLFSDSWHKVADTRVGLLYTVDVQKQYYRGALWYVLCDSFNHNYFKVSPEAYRFIAMLTPDKTVEEVWEKCLEVHKQSAPSQEEVLGLLSQLHTNNLLYFKNSPNNEFVWERRRERKRRELKSRLLSIISIKIPIWNPDRWLDRIFPVIKLVFSFKGLCVWAIVAFFGGKAIIDNFKQIYDQTQGMLSQSNLIFIYLSLAFLKSFHELAHSMMNKRFGGPVHTLGIMFLVFTPLPYMDATSSWFFQKSWQRILVGSAGMISDLFFAAIAAVIWANTGDGLVHNLAFNLMIIGSITSIVFNGNPLIRFDAYYIVSDLLEIPNLYQRARRQWSYWAERYLFKVENAAPPSDGSREALWLAAYGITSLIYRVFLTIVIILIVSDRIFAVGVILAILSLIIGIVKPAKELAAYLFASPKLAKTRKRAIAISSTLAFIGVSLLGFFPFPNAIRAPGIIEVKEFSKIYAKTEGKLEKVNFKSGEWIRKGDEIAILSNRELELDLKIVKAGLAQNKAMKQKAVSVSTSDLKPLYEREKVLNEQLIFIEEKLNNLTVIAETSGFFVAPDIESMQGRWLKRQTQLGAVIPNGELRFCAIVSQEQAFNLFKERHFQNQVKLYGNAGENLEIVEMVVIPFQRENLPSSVLGWLGGGDISVSMDEKSGRKAAEPFFEINGRILAPIKSSSLFLHGRSGVLRLTLPPEPLAFQGYRLIKQTAQKRYKI